MVLLPLGFSEGGGGLGVLGGAGAGKRAVSGKAAGSRGPVDLS
jgi:hypothetical protein